MQKWTKNPIVLAKEASSYNAKEEKSSKISKNDKLEEEEWRKQAETQIFLPGRGHKQCLAAARQKACKFAESQHLENFSEDFRAKFLPGSGHEQCLAVAMNSVSPRPDDFRGIYT